VNTILIVDDHASFRASARALLEADGFVVVGHADGAGAAMTTARSCQPDVALVDIGLPDEDGFEVAARLRAEHPGVLVVLTSSHDAASFGPRLKRSGCPFLPKDEISGAAIRALLVPA
jgi:DNA-binding NarL/FixJ family response regulator